MRTRAAAISLAALASLAASAAGAAPYPASGLVTGVSWDTATYRDGGLGGDLWPVTAGANGRLYTAWGDGTVTCPVRVSYGVASVAGGPSAALRRVGCGTPGDRAGKLISLLDVAGTLFAVAYLQGRPDTRAVAVWSSPDRGRTWRQPGPTFPGAAGTLQPNSFVQFGPGYAGARDGYVYLTATKAGIAPRAFYLMRVPRAGLGKAPYEYFAGTAAAPAWGESPGAARPVFADPKGVNSQDVVHDAGLGRYLVTAGHGADGSDGGGLGVFEGPEPWGPWRTVESEGRWLGIRGGSFLGLHFASRWMADGGRTLWGVFSCVGGACGRYDDRYNLMRARLTVRGAAASVRSDRKDAP
jgi:hypothetical protein